MEKCTLFPINHQDFCEMSSNSVVALESYPGMTQKSWRVDEMGIHMTLLLWCNMALFTVCRENKQLRVICGEKKQSRERNKLHQKKKGGEGWRKKWNSLWKKPASLWNYSVVLDEVCPDAWHCSFLIASRLFLAR